LRSQGKVELIVKDDERPVFNVLLAIGTCHLINDMLQSLLVAVYPTLKSEFHLSFAQIGLVTLAYQLTASLLQPVVGMLADRRPAPFSLPAGSIFTFVGLLVMAAAPTFSLVLAGACVLGTGSSVFHPESSRVARMAAGKRPGLAQSVFQVGGHIGSALGPIGAAIVVSTWGRRSVGVFGGGALVSAGILLGVALWCKRHALRASIGGATAPHATAVPSSIRRLSGPIAILLVLTFSKFVYVSSITSYYTFYLVHRFGLSVGSAQVHLFAFLAAGAAGALAGGPLGDRFGRKQVIWFSIAGALPFALALPYANLFWTGILSGAVAFVMASAFPAMVVYGQELVPGRVGLVAGLFFGLSFGAAGLGAGLLGRLADAAGIEAVYRACSFLPSIGLLGVLLPELRGRAAPGGNEASDTSWKSPRRAA
jgi:FSR family fosmidomycin resistance protein-like MFS transporter